MGKRKKLLEKFIKNPGSVKYKDLEKILLDCDFIKIEAKGSHKKFKHELLGHDLIIPVHNRDCKNFYKNYVANVLKALYHFE